MALPLLTVLTLSSCGGGGSSTPGTTQPAPSTALTGSFADVTLSGVGYSTPTVTGSTTATSSFNYYCTATCETVSFSVGGIALGQVSGTSSITLHDLTGGMDGGLLSETTIRRARLLMALDSDADPTNGVQISADVSNSLASKRIDFSATSFEIDLIALLDYVKADTKLSQTFRDSLKAPDKYVARSLLEQLEALNKGVFTETPTSTAIAASEVRKYVLRLPDNQLVPYTGQSNSVRTSYPRGLKPALGAGLAIVPGTAGQPVQLRSISSRGIVVSAPQYKDGVSTRAANVIVTNDTLGLPMVAVLELAAASFDLRSTVPLRASATEPFSGKPTPNGAIGSDGGRNLDETLKPANPEFDQLGIDPAGVRVASDGTYWVCDRRGPQLIQLDSTGRSLQRIAASGTAGNLPGVSRVLPALLGSRQPGLGCGGIAIRPVSGDVLMATAAALDIASQTASRARLLRLTSYNPRTGAIRQFGIANWLSDPSLQLMDIDAINEDLMLALFRYKDPVTGVYQFHLRSIDLASATELTGKVLTTGTSAGLQLEYGTSSDLDTSGIKLAPSTLILDLRTIGWSLPNPEGIARVDANTVYIIAQQNGGVTSKVTNGDAALEVADHSVDANGLIQPRASGSTTNPVYELVAAPAEQRQTVLWAIKLRNSLQ